MMQNARRYSVRSILGLFMALFCLSNFVLHHRMASWEQKTTRLSGSTKVDYSKPIFVVGMPKVGTSSIHAMFECSGSFKSSHYCCCGSNRTHTHCGDSGRSFSDCMRQNLKLKQPILDGCGDYDVYAQMDGEVGNSIYLPQHFALDSIHAFSPDSTFILNLRPVSDWVNSVTNWYGLGGRFLRRFHVDTRKANRTRALEDIFTNHSRIVRSFVRAHPSHKLIEFDITGLNAGAILAHEFGLNKSCWGRHNQNKRLRQQR